MRDLAKVIGVGGVFFTAPDRETLRHWWQDVPGIEFGAWGGAFFTPDVLASASGPGTVFAGFAQGTDYSEPSAQDDMINLMVDDLDAVLARCKVGGVEPAKLFPEEPKGRIAHIMDSEGRKIELWQPKAVD